MKKNLRVLLFLVFSSFMYINADNIPVDGYGDNSLNKFDRLIKAYMTKNEIPGASVAITKDSRLVYAKGFGYTDLKKEMAKPHSLFKIASLSKSITAAAVLQLVEQGRISLDDKVVSVLDIKPYSSDKFLDDRWKAITVKHLLQHEAGWTRKDDPMFRLKNIAKSMNIKKLPTSKELISYLMDKQLSFSPGEHYSYSNFGYIVLGRIIEKVTNTDYESYVNSNILKPLGISRMKIGDKILDSTGGWLASATDIIRFMSSFDNPDSSKILKKSTIDMMFLRKKGPSGYTNGIEKKIYYSFGWMVKTHGYAKDTYHTGSLSDASTMMIRRYDGVNWVVLFNKKENDKKQKLAPMIEWSFDKLIKSTKHWPEEDLF